MELGLCKETYSCYDVLPTLVETREQSAETIVPDYCPDIARIVESSENLFIRSCEITDGRVLISGLLRLTLLYIAEGNDGVRSLSYSLPFEELLDSRLRESGCKVHVSGNVSALEVRALNPRKLQTRAAIELTVTPYCAAQLVTCGDIAEREEHSIETLCRSKEVSIIQELHSKDFVFSDEFQLAGGKGNAAELLREYASVRVTECRLLGGKLIVKGVICENILYLSEDGTLCSEQAELPFSQIMDGCEDGDENTSVEVFLRLTGAELRIGGDSSESSAVSAKIFLHAFTVLRRRVRLHCITDLYSTSLELSAQMQTLELCGGVQIVTQEQSVREQMETGAEISSVLSASVSFSNTALVYEADAVLLRCTAMLHALYLDENGALLTVDRRSEISARTMVPNGSIVSIRDVTTCEVAAAAVAGGIEVRFPALFTMEVSEPCRCVCLYALEAERKYESTADAAPIVLRALHPGEQLWDLAKAYRTRVADILTANELTAEEDAPVGQLLLIPCSR